MDPSLLGQTVKNSLYHTQIPFVVVKKLYRRKDKTNNAFNFMVCVDGSEKGFKAFETCVILSNCENDEIYAVTAPNLQGDQNIETIKVKFQELEEKHKGKKINFMALEPSYDPGKSLIDFVNFNEKIDFDFVVLGNNGIRAQLEGKQFLGRMAENVLANIKANPIIIP